MLAQDSAQLGAGDYVARSARRLILAACAALGLWGTVQAAPLPPLAGFEPDNGASYFTPASTVVGIELADVLEPFSSFGFYFEAAPGVLIPLFDATDLSSVGTQVSAADFDVGLVLDIDAGATVKGGFAPGVGPIGFFVDVLGTTLYSDPVLNPGGLDLFSAFQDSADPSLWGVAFEGINEDGSLSPISINLVGGISLVPEPSVLALLVGGLGLAWSGASRRRRLESRGALAAI